MPHWFSGYSRERAGAYEDVPVSKPTATAAATPIRKTRDMPAVSPLQLCSPRPLSYQSVHESEKNSLAKPNADRSPFFDR